MLTFTRMGILRRELSRTRQVGYGNLLVTSPNSSQPLAACWLSRLKHGGFPGLANFSPISRTPPAWVFAHRPSLPALLAQGPREVLAPKNRRFWPGSSCSEFRGSSPACSPRQREFVTPSRWNRALP